MSRKQRKRERERETASRRRRSESMMGLLTASQSGLPSSHQQRARSVARASTAPVNGGEDETLPAGWVWSTIGEVAEIQLGRQRSPEHHQGSQMRVYLRAANVTKSGLSLDDVKEMNFDDTDFEKYRLEPGDLLLNEAWNPGGASLPVIWDGELEDCCFQNTLFRLRPVGVLLDYLYWYCYFAACTDQFAEASRGVTIRHLGKRGLTRFPIPIVPVEEQRRIVDVVEEHLSRLDAADAGLHASREKLDQIERSILHKALTPPRTPNDDMPAPGNAGDDLPAPGIAGDALPAGWRSTTLGEVADIEMGQSPPGHTYNDRGEGLPFLQGSAEFGDDYPMPNRWCSEPKRIAEPGDLLLSVRAPVGDTNFAAARVAYGRGLARVRSTDLALAEYMRLLLQSKVARLNENASGTTFAAITAMNLRGFAVVVPPVEEQRRIVEVVEEQTSHVAHLKQAVDSAISHAGSLRRSILAAALSGRLTAEERAA